MDNQEEQETEVKTEPVQAPTQEEEHQEPAQRKGLSYKNQFDWNLQSFDEETALKDLSRLANQNLAIQQSKNDPRLFIAESSIKSLTLNKQHIYILKGQNQQYDKIQITRKYSDFQTLRDILVKRWPGCLIPPIPDGNIGATEKQIFKNKEHIVTSFINRMLANQPIFKGEQFQIFIKSAQNQVQKNLNQLKPHSLQEIYEIYKAAWPQDFNQVHEITIQNYSQKIKKFEDYFSEMKKDLASQKDQIRRLAELRTKVTAQRYHVLEKALPEYEEICLGWFNGRTQLPDEEGEKKQQKKEEDKKEQKEQGQQKKEQEQIIQEKQPKIQNRIYSSPKYQSALEAYKDQLFPKADGQNDDWLIYEQFKYELKEIEAMLQAITTYKYLLSEKRYYQRNIESNKQQLEDINNNKMSLKILFLSGSEDEKKTQIANETQILQTKFKIIEELWNAITQRVVNEIEGFQGFRCEFYKKNLMRAFKKEAIYMAKLFNLYVEIHKL